MGNKKNYRDLDLLVQKAIQGDKKAFSKLCEREASQIIYLCAKRMGNLHDGEDAAQEVFITLQTRITSLNAPEAYVTWLQKIIFYVCTRMRQKKMNHAEMVPVEELEDLYSETDASFLPEEYFQKQEKREELLAVIDKLSEQTRSCILMHYFSELKISEISQILNITEGSVKGSLYLGRTKIRKAFEQKDQNNQLSAVPTLPMAALSGLFRQEMAQMVSPAVVRHCLGGCGLLTAKAALLLQLPAAKTVLAAICVSATVTTLFVSVPYFASRPPNVSLSTQPVPQQAYMEKANWAEDTAAEQAAPLPETASPGSSPSGPGGQATVEEPAAPKEPATPIEPTTPEKPAVGSGQTAGTGQAPKDEAPALPATLSGRVYLEDAAQPGLFLHTEQLMDVELKLQDAAGREIAKTRPNAEGMFTLQVAAVYLPGTYRLHMALPPQGGFTSGRQNPQGYVEVPLKPGETVKGVALYLHHQADGIQIELEGGNCACGHLNPATAKFTGAAFLQCHWELVRNTDAAILASGEGSTLAQPLAQLLAKGENGGYTIHFTALTLSGETAEMERSFQIFAGEIEAGQFD